MNYFEKLFLEETEQFYRVEVNDLVTDDSIIIYMKKVLFLRFNILSQKINTFYFRLLNVLDEEEDRVKKFLHLTTLEKLKPLLQKILVENQLQLMQDEAKSLLRNERIEG